jgi:dolichol-phosphate mannosyltransferase
MSKIEGNLVGYVLPSLAKAKIAVVIPCYKVKAHILNVISEIPSDIELIYVVDDACPENSGKYVQSEIHDARVHVIFNSKNLGVGGAVKEGYSAAIKDAVDIVVKIDGDGQMSISDLDRLLEPILSGHADYTKGNRFFFLSGIKAMPKIRILGNLALSFFTKISSGYHNIFDPNNGYTAIARDVLEQLDFDEIDNRYFFESDMLFNLYGLRAVVKDIPMQAAYNDEISNLHIRKIIMPFLFKNMRNAIKRVFYSYYLRDFNMASVELPTGAVILSFGLSEALINWLKSWHRGISTPLGTQILATLSILIGFQLVLNFISYDVSNFPKESISSLGKGN